MSRTVADALDDFMDQYRKTLPTLRAPWREDWRSPCEVGEVDQVHGETPMIHWRPVRNDTADVLAPVEAALEIAVHPDLKTYWGRYYSSHLDAAAPDGALSLLQLWNVADSERLVENQIGHVLTQRQAKGWAKGPLTFFFGCTEDAKDDYLLTVHNTTGEVLLELPGRKPIRVLAPSLAAFIDELTPRSNVEG